MVTVIPASEVTVTEADPETLPTAAVTVPPPALEPAVKTVDEPPLGARLPGAFVVQRAFATPTGLPY